MATPKTFFCYMPDLPDAAPRRAHIRPKHIEVANKRRATGQIVVGGAILDNDGNMVGSGMVLKADSEEAAWAVIREDHYWHANVWDKEKIIVRPYRVNGLPQTQAKL
ncbi:YCII-related domain protein [Calocera viscosa TUFC12733]|uniref:YCII-related domain protein n=1 Tax=Calocera viscosa (strain TUFC12733) TaxID=1330018 RepID=A0A167HSG5_CALVF|nr:YCII-related domain protein [Calocera viscosa TUFC12733]